MELLEMMKQRRSIRKYEQRPVEREKLEKILEAGAKQLVESKAESL